LVTSITLHEAGLGGFDCGLVAESPMTRVVQPPPRVEVRTDSELRLHPYGVGIDCHSKFVQVCVLDSRSGQVQRHDREFKTTWSDLGRADDWIRTLVGEKPYRYTLESTGCYHRPVVLRLGPKASLVNPLLAGPSRRKTDVLDAYLLAYQSLTGLWPESYIVPLAVEQVRILLALRRKELRHALRCRNTLNNVLLRYGYTFGQLSWFRREDVRALLADLLQGRTPQNDYCSNIPIPNEVRDELARLIHQAEAHEGHAQYLHTRALEIVRRLPGSVLGGRTVNGDELLKRLVEVPGVGVGTALTFIAEVGHPGRFRDKKQVAAFCGCDPSLKVSAGKVTQHVRRKGNVVLHRALVQAGAAILRGDPPSRLGQWGRAIRGRHKKGGFKKACAALARKLSVILWSMWKDGTRWDDRLHGSMLEPVNRPLKGLLRPRVVKLLETAGITTTAHLAANQERLATIKGLGEKSLQDIRQLLSSRELWSSARS